MRQTPDIWINHLNVASIFKQFIKVLQSGNSNFFIRKGRHLPRWALENHLLAHRPFNHFSTTDIIIFTFAQWRAKENIFTTKNIKATEKKKRKKSAPSVHGNMMSASKESRLKSHIVRQQCTNKQEESTEQSTKACLVHSDAFRLSTTN